MLVSKILNNDVLGFNEEANTRIQELLARKLVEIKQQVAFNLYGLDEEYELVEEDEDVNELSKDTLGRYVNKASGDTTDLLFKGRVARNSSDKSKAFKKLSNRGQGISLAAKRLAKEDEDLDEARVTGTKLSKSGKRWKIVRARVRKGNVQRNRRVTNTAGYTFRNSLKNHELVRMSPTERRNRKRGQKLGKIKRKAKMTSARLKRKRSDRKRKAIGL